MRFLLEWVDEPYFNWHAVQDEDDERMSVEFYAHYDAAKAWCLENLNDNNWRPFDEELTLFFRRDVDATAFKVVWG
jgi:hypothetical protein